MSLTAACCAEYPGAWAAGVLPLLPDCFLGCAADSELDDGADAAFSFFFLEAAVGSLRLRLDPLEVVDLSLGGLSCERK